MDQSDLATLLASFGETSVDGGRHPATTRQNLDFDQSEGGDSCWPLAEYSSSWWAIGWATGGEQLCAPVNHYLVRKGLTGGFLRNGEHQ